jgi:hypothetical protein
VWWLKRIEQTQRVVTALSKVCYRTAASVPFPSPSAVGAALCNVMPCQGNFCVKQSRLKGQAATHETRAYVHLTSRTDGGSCIISSFIMYAPQQVYFVGYFLALSLVKLYSV